jgi:hypothetical protein
MKSNGQSTNRAWRHGIAARVATGMLVVAVIGCGGSQEERSSTNAGATEASSGEQSGAMVVATLPVPANPATETEAETVPSADSLPPDVVASVASQVVVPGEAVEILAMGSPDVREVILADGIGRTQSFVYDLEAKAWRTFYRMPMTLHGEKLGLSVTAKNDGNRWRRVWLFLRTEPEGVPPDSGSTQPQ